MKTKPVLIWTAISLFFVIFVGLVFLPAILSSNLLKPAILETVNRHLPGRLQVAEWRFKWFSGIEAKGIVYDHRQGRSAQDGQVGEEESFRHEWTSFPSKGKDPVQGPRSKKFVWP